MTRRSGLRRIAAAGLLFSAAGVWHAGQVHAARAPGAADPQRFRLAATGKLRVTSAWASLLPALSPFGLAVTDDGHLVYDLTLEVHGLPPASQLGYATYVAWVTTPNVEMVHELGELRGDSTLHAQVEWNKFTVVVTAERSAGGAKWAGPIVLVGRSPSSLMQSFADHPFYKTGQPPF